MKNKRLLSLLLCLTLAVSALCGFAACAGEDKVQTGNPPVKNELAEELKQSLKAYLSTEDFRKSVLSAATAQARIPLLYLRYVDDTFYSTDNVIQFRKYLNYINDIIDGGKIADHKFSASPIATQGWYGIVDYLYTWSFIYNQYLQWCHETQTVDETTEIYVSMVTEYLTYVDTWLADSAASQTEYEGETITNPYTTGINIVNNITSATLGIKTHPLSWWEGFLEIVAERTGSTVGHAEFLKAYASAEQMTDSELRGYKATLVALWKNLVPTQQVSFGYNVYQILPMIAANVGADLKSTVPYCYGFMKAYYDKDENGDFVKDGGTPNWVGFSGRPLCGTLFRGDVDEETFLRYEKTMQGYFPFTDGWSQPLDEMVNLDRLCNYYNHTLNTGANVTPQYGLLYGMACGIDMAHYKKEAPATDLGETGEEEFNVIALWRQNLSKDDDGSYVIDNFTDMAVAIAYIAQTCDEKAPSPLGLYSADVSVIKL